MKKAKSLTVISSRTLSLCVSVWRVEGDLRTCCLEALKWLGVEDFTWNFGLETDSVIMILLKLHILNFLFSYSLLLPIAFVHKYSQNGQIHVISSWFIVYLCVHTFHALRVQAFFVEYTRFIQHPNS